MRLMAWMLAVVVCAGATAQEQVAPVGTRARVLQPEAACTPTALACGATVTGSLSPSSSCIVGGFPTANYSISGTAGQTITLTASNTSGYDMFLTLTNSSGTTIATSYLDEPASIQTTLPATGQYFLALNFGNPNTSSSYSLSSTCTTGNPTTCTYTATLAIGQQVSGQLTSSDTACGDTTSYVKVYKLPVNAGDAFEVTYSASYPVYLEIHGPDSSGAWRSATSNSLTTSYIAPTSGNVSIYVGSSTSSPVTGSFTLQIAPLTLPACGKLRAVKH